MQGCCFSGCLQKCGEQLWLDSGLRYVDAGPDTMLVSCGDDGLVRGWRLAELEAACSGSYVEQPHACFEHRISLTPSAFGLAISQQPAAQAMTVDNQNNTLFVGMIAAGATKSLPAVRVGPVMAQALKA